MKKVSSTQNSHESTLLMPPHVSLTMIVKNEEAHLPQCLDCAKDLFAEIVVIDTGSTDATRQIAVRSGARVYDFPWIDDFAAARNESLRHATGQWIFWLDADDRIDLPNRGKLQALFADLKSQPLGYLMRCHSQEGWTGNSTTATEHIRLFPNHPEIRWRYRIHEQILPAIERQGGKLVRTDIVVHHCGYVDAVQARRKLERNLRLLEWEHAELPNDPNVLYNLGRNYLAVGRTSEALPHLRRSLELARPSDPFVRKLYGQLARAYCQLRQRDEALSACRNGLAAFPHYAELLFLYGQLHQEAGDLEGAKQCYLRLLQPGVKFVGEDLDLPGYKARQNLGGIYFQQRLYSEAEAQWRTVAAVQPDYLPAWMGLAALWLTQGRSDEFESTARQLEGNPSGVAMAAMLRARLHAARNDLTAAKHALSVAIAQVPQDVRPRVMLSEMLMHEGRDAAAIEQALRDVLAQDPNHEPTRRNLATLLERRASGQ
jgi:glycosyltransferase involved in cell wall biosynthesis